MTGISVPGIQDDQPWSASIRREGRWTWRVHVSQGLIGRTDYVLGRRRAERKARRELRKLTQQDEWHKEEYEVDQRTERRRTTHPGPW